MCLCASESTGEEPAGINASGHVLTQGATHKAHSVLTKLFIIIIMGKSNLVLSVVTF